MSRIVVSLKYTMFCTSRLFSIVTASCEPYVSCKPLGRPKCLELIIEKLEPSPSSASSVSKRLNVFCCRKRIALTGESGGRSYTLIFLLSKGFGLEMTTRNVDYTSVFLSLSERKVDGETISVKPCVPLSCNLNPCGIGLTTKAYGLYSSILVTDSWALVSAGSYPLSVKRLGSSEMAGSLAMMELLSRGSSIVVFEILFFLTRGRLFWAEFVEFPFFIGFGLPSIGAS